MKRDEFLTTFGIGLAAVCTGCLTSCSKGDENVLPGSTTNFTLDLNTDIRNVSDSKVISGVIVVRLAATNAPASFTAVQVACTHEQFPIE
ncbi:MAG TPA: hypothetical protein VNI52_01010 [Sphingobacteriaceae bacterium]|nr:hypothetical protein [Sphingobacteriaceae bacterium]